MSLVLVFVASQLACAQSGPSKGTLVLEGGAATPVPEVAQRFVKLAGGANAHIVYIPTAAGEEQLTPEVLKHLVERLKIAFALQDIAVVHTRDRKVADSEQFVAPLRKATGIWFSGGKAEFLAEVYLGTRTQREFAALLQRGGVLGGDSAGAVVMGTVMLPGHDRGFEFLTNVAVNVHVVQKSAEDELAKVVAENPSLLGIGLDANAGIVVIGDEFEVTGRSVVLVTDGKSHEGSSYLKLVPGDRYNMKTRIASLLSPVKRREVMARPEITHRGPAVSKQLEGDWRANVSLLMVSLQYVLHIKNLPDHTVSANLQMIGPKANQSGATIKISQIKQDGPQVEFVSWGSEPSQPLIKGTLNHDHTEISGYLLVRTKVPITLKKIKTLSTHGQ
jgi:cyanophycinase